MRSFAEQNSVSEEQSDERMALNLQLGKAELCGSEPLLALPKRKGWSSEVIKTNNGGL